MNGKFSERTTPLMISAMRRACSSLSITQGPAIRNKSPAPTRTLSIWKERVTKSCSHRARRRTQGQPGVTILSLSSRQFFGAQKHFDHRSIFLLFLFLPVLVRSADEFFKQRMRLQRLRLEFGMELASQGKRMARNFNHLYISTVGS